MVMTTSTYVSRFEWDDDERAPLKSLSPNSNPLCAEKPVATILKEYWKEKQSNMYTSESDLSDLSNMQTEYEQEHDEFTTDPNEPRYDEGEAETEQNCDDVVVGAVDDGTLQSDEPSKEEDVVKQVDPLAQIIENEVYKKFSYL